MMVSLRPNAYDEVASALAEGVRYERGGVVVRARDSFEKVAQRWEDNAPAAAEAWWRLANLHRLGSRWDEALKAVRAAITLAHEHELPNVEADALNIEGVIWLTRGEFSAARALFLRTIDLATSPSTRAKALQNLGYLEGEEHSFDEAERLFLASREDYRSVGDARGEAVSLLNLGRLQLERGDPLLARETLYAAERVASQAADLELHASALLNLGIALSALGMHAQAEERITTAYGQFTIADNSAQRVRCLMDLATVALARGDATTARVCLLHARGVASDSELPRDVRQIDEQLATVERQL